MTSAYPTTFEDLVPAVREMAAELGRLPSRNKVMGTFRIGAPKAMKVLDAVKLASFEGVQPVDVAPPVTPVVDVDEPTVVLAEPGSSATLDTTETRSDEDESSQVTPVGHPVRKSVPSWPLWLLAAPAFIAVWSGWVGLGGLTGFGVVRPLPGIADSFELNTAITLPIGLEAYGAYALSIWLSGAAHTHTAKRFAAYSALASLVLGGAGQIAYHLMTSAGITVAPWPVTTAVACLPVVVLGCAAALRHLISQHDVEVAA